MTTNTELAAVLAVHEPMDAVNFHPSLREPQLTQVCGGRGCATEHGDWHQWPCPPVRAARAEMAS